MRDIREGEELLADYGCAWELRSVTGVTGWGGGQSCVWLCAVAVACSLLRSSLAVLFLSRGTRSGESYFTKNNKLRIAGIHYECNKSPLHVACLVAFGAQSSH